jgi:GAF domain-containing protein
LNTTLEQRVLERTSEIERRARYLEATAIVSREVNIVLDVEELLERVVQLISDQFGFYHTGLFLLDQQAQWAVLRAASSEGGRRMLVRGHRLRVGQQGVVGWVADHGEHRIALDVGQDAVYFDNPDLPETRSEMALPLRARGEILGVLDVQSTEAGLFGAEDVSALQALADQVALAISNARLFEQAEAALLAERKIQGERMHEAWRDLIRTAGQVGFVSDYRGTTVADGEWGPRMWTAVQNGETAFSASDRRALAVPVKVRGQTVGAIDAYQPVDGGEWTTEQREILETLAERVGVALESAQLYQEAQGAAAREQLAMRISQRIREALDVEDILRVTSNALGRELDAQQVMVRLGTEQILLGERRT